MLHEVLVQSRDSGHSHLNAGELGLTYLLRRLKREIKRMDNL